MKKRYLLRLITPKEQCKSGVLIGALLNRNGAKIAWLFRLPGEPIPLAHDRARHFAAVYVSQEDLEVEECNE